MKQIVRVVSRFSDLVQKISLTVSGVILITLVAVAGLGVVFRFLLHSSLSWNEELDGYLFVWLTCLGAAIGYKYRAHPQVVILIDRLPNLLKKTLVAIADTVVLVLGVILLVYGGQMVSHMGTETAASLPISMKYPYLAIPVGGAALIVHSAAHILNGLFASHDRTVPNSPESKKEGIAWEHSA